MNADEQQTYGSFLQNDFFTKKDFGKLARFYTHTWDRLSQSGKDEMSHRVWEGVRHHEYKFSDLPDPVKEREETQVYRRLRESSVGLRKAADVPEDDKAEFYKAYENKNHREAAKILDRESFRQNLFLSIHSKEIKHSAVSANKSGEADTVAAVSSNGAEVKRTDQSAPAGALDSLDLASFDLAGMKPADHLSEGSVANLPRSRGGKVRES